MDCQRTYSMLSLTCPGRAPLGIVFTAISVSRDPLELLLSSRVQHVLFQVVRSSSSCNHIYNTLCVKCSDRAPLAIVFPLDVSSDSLGLHLLSYLLHFLFQAIRSSSFCYSMCNACCFTCSARAPFCRRICVTTCLKRSARALLVVVFTTRSVSSGPIELLLPLYPRLTRCVPTLLVVFVFFSFVSDLPACQRCRAFAS